MHLHADPGSLESLKHCMLQKLQNPHKRLTGPCQGSSRVLQFEIELKWEHYRNWESYQNLQRIHCANNITAFESQVCQVHRCDGRHTWNKCLWNKCLQGHFNVHMYIQSILCVYVCASKAKLEWWAIKCSSSMVSTHRKLFLTPALSSGLPSVPPSDLNPDSWVHRNPNLSHNMHFTFVRAVIMTTLHVNIRDHTNLQSKSFFRSNCKSQE
jgi:hypothetical protein